MKKVTVDLSTSGIERLQKAVREYKQWQKKKTDELTRRLAMLGATTASLRFSKAIYTGPKDAVITVEEIDNGYVVKAEGECVLFVEFGSGIKYGSGHPENAEYGMGPGTYPNGKGHWDDPHGWYLPKDKGGGHTYGNPPTMAMYDARKTIEQDLVRIVREVFV
jgi:hypothetical protein